MKRELFKLDAGKVRLDLLPTVALAVIARVLEHGASKYAPYAWIRNAGEWSRLYAAAQRHMFAFWDGTDLDEGKGGTGLPHLAHAACCILFLLTYQLLGLGKDDRFKRE